MQVTDMRLKPLVEAHITQFHHMLSLKAMVTGITGVIFRQYAVFYGNPVKVYLNRSSFSESVFMVFLAEFYLFSI